MSLKAKIKAAIRENPFYINYIQPFYSPIRNYLEFKFLTDEQYFVRRHRNIFGYTPDFKNPQTFNEKIIHRILFDRSPIYTALADKLKARIYIATTLLPFYEGESRERERDEPSLIKT